MERAENKSFIKMALTSLLDFSQYFDLAADVLAENAHLTYKFLSPVSNEHPQETSQLILF